MIPRFGTARHAFSRALLIGILGFGPAGIAAAGGSALQLVGVDDQTLELSLEQLEAMPQVIVATENEFSDGVVDYRGPLVRDVLARVGLDKLDQVRFTAANDYFVDIPTEDFTEYDAILAMEADGEKLGRREKGPLWLMYPISDHSELQRSGLSCAG